MLPWWLNFNFPLPVTINLFAADCFVFRNRLQPIFLTDWYWCFWQLKVFIDDNDIAAVVDILLLGNTVLFKHDNVCADDFNVDIIDDIDDDNNNDFNDNIIGDIDLLLPLLFNLRTSKFIFLLF